MKNDAINRFKNFVALTENQIAQKVKSVHTNGGGEFTSCTFHQFIQKRVLAFYHSPWSSCTKQPHQVKHMHLTILKGVCTVLSQVSFPTSFWGRWPNILPFLVIAHLTPLQQFLLNDGMASIYSLYISNPLAWEFFGVITCKSINSCDCSTFYLSHFRWYRQESQTFTWHNFAQAITHLQVVGTGCLTGCCCSSCSVYRCQGHHIHQCNAWLLE